jgi:hypothetical protein
MKREVVVHKRDCHTHLGPKLGAVERYDCMDFEHI